ncbi:hypothetical protein L873DRAFT_1742374 [Choiromyces venosus 120613-1]|uniref:RBR-type E3 ubiquitin transferase n=1 Tax=Choiromyces venosus 120613-1 TaxID=1336337 RepID=A0A3N4JLA9_9PEZI|nr:hypothetical protein L873DRAFT_1742374 [Choiromyces venosus 120613-1]
MDELTEKLIISLQLQDIEELLASRKGKGRQGDLITSADELALNTYRRFLQESEQDIIDRSLARGLDGAVRADDDNLVERASAERVAENDGNFALRQGGKGKGKAEARSTGSELRALALGLDDTENVTEVAMNEWQARLMLEDLAGVTPGPSRTFTRTGQNKCQICFEMFSTFSTLSAPCGHIYCQSCMKEVFLNACIDEMLFPPRCCKKEIPLHMGEKVLSGPEVSEFRSKCSEYSSKNRTYCCKPSCSKFIPSDRIDGDVGSCPECFTRTCVICKKEEHPGDCPEDKSLDLTLELAAQSGWQRCKNCHALVEISSGCHHMTCRCKAEWCYKCGVTWKQCQCGDWDVGRLARRAEELAMREAPRNAAPATFAQLVTRFTRGLEVNHECEHVSGWRYRSGGAQCEMCDFYLPEYIFACKQCELLACNRCRKNRI